MIVTRDNVVTVTHHREEATVTTAGRKPGKMPMKRRPKPPPMPY